MAGVSGMHTPCPDLLREGTTSPVEKEHPLGCRGAGPSPSCEPPVHRESAPLVPSGTALTDTLGCRVLAFGDFGVALATHEIIRKPISQSPAEPGCPSDLGAAGGSTHEYLCLLAPVP